MNVFPDLSAAADEFGPIIGALLMFVLVVSVLMLLICAVVWGVSSSTGNYQGATKARIGCFVAIGAAALAGAGVAWANFLIGVGDTL